MPREIDVSKSIELKSSLLDLVTFRPSAVSAWLAFKNNLEKVRVTHSLYCICCVIENVL